MAFLLNLATMALIKNTSALTLNVSGVFKDIGLIFWSVLVSGAVVTHLQYAGYLVAVIGVSLYSAYKRAQQTAAPSQAPTAPQPPVKRGYSDVRASGAAAEEAQPLASPEAPAAATPDR